MTTDEDAEDWKTCATALMLASSEIDRLKALVLELEAACKDANDYLDRAEKAETRVLELAESRAEILYQRDVYHAELKQLRERVAKALEIGADADDDEIGGEMREVLRGE